MIYLKYKKNVVTNLDTEESFMYLRSQHFKIHCWADFVYRDKIGTGKEVEHDYMKEIYIESKKVGDYLYRLEHEPYLEKALLYHLRKSIDNEIELQYVRAGVTMPEDLEYDFELDPSDWYDI